MHYAKEVINAMAKKNKLFIITSRGLLTEKEIEVTNSRLKQENLNFEKIAFNSKGKLQDCLDLKIDLMIEDNFKNVEKLSKNGIKCLHFMDIVNRRCKNENVVEVRNWGEVFVELVKLGVVNKNDVQI